MNKSFNYVFLLGRPGSGKSQVFHLITSKLKESSIADEFQRIDDFPKLLEINAEDTGNLRHKPIPGGGFLVLDDTVWADVLQKVNKDALVLDDAGKMVFIEFARDKYKRALSNFTPSVLKKAMIIYIDCPFNIAWQRNVDRVNRQKAQGIDAHLTSREEMEKTYLKDDFNEIKDELQIPYIILKNDSNSLPLLEKRISGILQEFLKK